MKRCKNCGKELKDTTSKNRGYGPECWNKLMAKDRLDVQIILITGNSQLDRGSFETTDETTNMVITFDLRDVQLFKGGFIELSDTILEEGGVATVIRNSLHHEHHYGGLDVNLYVRKKMVAAGVMPKVPPNMIGLPREDVAGDIEGEWDSVLGFHSQRIDLMKLVPWKWGITKDNKLTLKSKMEVCTGSLFQAHDIDWDGEVEGLHEGDWLPVEDELGEWEKKGKTVFWDENPELNYLRQMFKGKIICLKSDTQPDIIGEPYDHHVFVTWQEENIQREALWQTEHHITEVLGLIAEDVDRYNFEEMKRKEHWFDWVEEFDCESETDYNFWKLHEFFDEPWMEKLYSTIFYSDDVTEGKCRLEALSSYDWIKKHRFGTKVPPLVEQVKMHMWVKRNQILDYTVEKWLEECQNSSYDYFCDIDEEAVGNLFGMTPELRAEMNGSLEDLGKEILDKVMKCVWMTDTEIFQRKLLED